MSTKRKYKPKNHRLTQYIKVLGKQNNWNNYAEKVDAIINLTDNKNEEITKEKRLRVNSDSEGEISSVQSFALTSTTSSKRCLYPVKTVNDSAENLQQNHIDDDEIIGDENIITSERWENELAEWESINNPGSLKGNLLTEYTHPAIDTRAK
ncbi:2674_t:CDS:2 [Funneliformis caledonium]|uniref:2674_t:CDS:1 n=1 Tax=Funneliformis caledonium TaxID=1117310 RepID=A0A9N9EBV6_9GLOM|nr:2674_t:CDS:2 [Funneliformis caledonium]